MIESRVYEAGIALMLLQAVGRGQPEAPRIAEALAAAIEPRSGWWGYVAGARSAEPAGDRPAFGPDLHASNLSTSQFAALGLWAAGRLDVRVAPSVWRRHAEAMLLEQAADGSWPYVPLSWLQPPGHRGPRTGGGYPTGTFMGLANLLLAREALRAQGQASDELLRRLDEAAGRARTALERDASLFLSSLVEGRRPSELSRVPGGGALYEALALEKACLFADLETLAEPIALAPLPGTKPDPGERPRTTRHWYVALAEWLLSTQTNEGGWTVEAEAKPGRRPDVIDTSFGLLILLRAASTLHPTTPTEIDPKPRGPVTPGEAPPPEKPK